MKKKIIIAVFLCTAAPALQFLPVRQAHADTSCTPYASKQCISNVVYWYNSCGVLQDIAQNCNTTGQTCSNGACVARQNHGTAGNVQHYVKSCYNDNLYWYSSAGKPTDLYKSCKGQNSCTLDTCVSNKCSNELKCDGSTCSVNSADYVKYCSQGNQGQSSSQTIPIAQGGQYQAKALAVTFFVKRESEPVQWEKYASVNNNEKVYFLITVKNTSTQPLNDVTVVANLPQGVSYTNDVKVDNAPFAGSILSGINLGTLNPESSKSATFSGIVQSGGQNLMASAQITSGIVSDSDSLTISTVGQSQNSTAAVSSTSVSSNNSSLVDFLKKWYPWIIIIAVLVILFVVIFRRLSSEV